MEFINGDFFVSKNDLIKGQVMDYDAIIKAKKRSSNNMRFINNPNGTKDFLIEYSSLPPKYISIADEKIGKNIKLPELCKLQNLKSRIVGNPDDSDKIRKFILPNGNNLSEETIEFYTKAAKYLHFLSHIKLNEIKKYGFIDATDFYNKISALIKSENLPLPSSYFKLREKVRQYKLHGACGIISKRFGQAHNLKIGSIEQAFIAQLYGKGNAQFSAARVTLEYNSIAVQNGCKPVTSRTIINTLKNPIIRQQIIGQREGVSAYREFADTVVHRSRPTRPNMLWVGDGTPFELYYQKEQLNEKGHRTVNYNERKVVYFVIDAFNDFIVGYAIGDQENNSLAKLAWRNACVNTGILPNQVKTDRYGLTEMRPFYSKIAKDESHFSPSAVGNARDKVIEQFFYKLRNEIVREYPSHSGGNITGKQQVNRDYLNKIKHSFPSEHEVIMQIQDIIERWNKMERPKMQGKSKLEQWNEGDHSQNRLLTDKTRLEIFGTSHDYTNRLTNKGIVCTLEGVTRKYNLLENKFADTIGIEYNIIYDPYDFSNILCVANEGRLKFVVPEFEPLPMAMGDQKAGDRTRLNTILNFKKNRFDINIERNKQHMDLLQAKGLLRVVQGKEAINEAENRYKQITNPDIFDSEETNILPVQIKKQDGDIFDED